MADGNPIRPLQSFHSTPPYCHHPQDVRSYRHLQSVAHLLLEQHEVPDFDVGPGAAVAHLYYFLLARKDVVYEWVCIDVTYVHHQSVLIIAAGWTRCRSKSQRWQHK